MDFKPGLRLLIDERADTPRLRAGKILADHAARREIDRKLAVHRVAALAPLQLHELRPAIRMEKPPALEQAGSAGMIDRRTRPEDSLPLIDLFVRDAVVIGDAAARG